MKKQILITLAVSLALGFGATFSSCKKKTDDTNNTTETGTVKLEMENVWNESNALEFNKQYVQSETGDSIKITLLKYYVSNIKFKKTDGSWWAAPESYYLVDHSKAESNVLTINNVPKADYTGVEFTIGVDSTRNVSGAQTGALSTTEGMFWSWSSGYIFWKCEGNSPQSPSKTFQYHVGGFSGAYSAIRKINSDFSGAVMGVKPTATPQIHFMLQVERIWNGTNKLSSVNNVTMPGMMASGLATNLAGAIGFEHLHN